MGYPALDLTGKTAVVTGGSRGLGYGMALALAQAGSNVVVVSRKEADAAAAAREIEKAAGEAGSAARAVGLETDVTSILGINGMVERTAREFGRLDIMVNNAGTAITKKALDITEEDWDRVLDTNLKGVFFCCQAAGRIMAAQGKGKIINIASVAGAVGDVSVSPYCAAKGGVIQLTKALALEWARYHINVNAIGPGYVKTALNSADLENEKVYQHIIRKTPMKRLGLAGDLGGAVIYLASDASDYVTGHTLFVDGGWVAE